MSTTMEQIHHIRELFYGQGMNMSEISTETGLAWNTVRKYVDMTDFNLAPPKNSSNKNVCPKLDPFKPVIDQWLFEDKQAPRKQRHTATRVFNRLQKESNDFNCSYRLVAEYVAVKKKEMKLGKTKGYIPLVHSPGEAQADFGSADFFENGKRHSGKYLVLSFPYSNYGYLQLNYGENLECLLEGLKTMFEYMGGVPTEIWFDNASTMVTEIIKGGGRNLTERFMCFREHYGFKSVFMNPGAGWEKGSGENKVGYDRRNLLVPMPRFLSLSGYNRQLLVDCDKDAKRKHYRIDADISELFEEDRKHFLKLPTVEFDTANYRTLSTNNWGKFYLHKGLHEYSVSPDYQNTHVELKLTSSSVIVMDSEMNEIITHKRLYGDNKQQNMEWLPYLKFISSKPRSLKNSGIYDMMPTNMQQFLDDCPTSERGRVLKTLSQLTDRTGFESALLTVNEAIVHQSVDADSLENLHRRLYADVPELPPMVLDKEIPKMQQFSANLTSYDEFLLERGVVNE